MVAVRPEASLIDASAEAFRAQHGVEPEQSTGDPLVDNLRTIAAASLKLDHRTFLTMMGILGKNGKAVDRVGSTAGAGTTTLELLARSFS